MDYSPEENPGFLIENISFSRFRTAGMRRSVKEGSQARFVTSERLLHLLRGTRVPGDLTGMSSEVTPEEWPEGLKGRLKTGTYYDFSSSRQNVNNFLYSVGFTEFMDSAISHEVLDELLLRGGHQVEFTPPFSQKKAKLVKKIRGTPLALSCEPIVALDLCGCVSARFASAMEEFLSAHNLVEGASGNQDDSDDDMKQDEDQTMTGWTSGRGLFPHLKRLGLHSVTLRATLLTPLISSFPHLTHLDITESRATPSFLQALADSKEVKLVSLSLAKCKGLTSDSIRDFLCADFDQRHNVTRMLEDLSLYGDDTNPTPLTYEDFQLIIANAPCFNSKLLRTLDISSTPLDDTLLSQIAPLPRLIELGLASCRNLTLPAVAQFLEKSAPNVEVLDLTNSCTGPVVVGRPNTFIRPIDLHGQLIGPIAMPDPPPLIPIPGVTPPLDLTGRKTKLRVLELNESTLEKLAGGAANWHVIWGNGRRGWYVDTGVIAKSVGDGTDPTNRKLHKLKDTDDEKRALTKLEELNGSLPGDVGWHPRKMEGMQSYVTYLFYHLAHLDFGLCQF